MLQGLARTCVRDIDPQVSCCYVAFCADCCHASLVADSYSCLSRLQNDLTYFRIATKKFEIMVAPHFGNAKYTAAGAQKEKSYTLFVLQRKPGQTA